MENLPPDFLKIVGLKILQISAFKISPKFSKPILSYYFQNVGQIFCKIFQKSSVLKISVHLFLNLRTISESLFSQIILLKYINLPEAIPLSDRPGHFFSIRFLTRSASGHTTVPQTGFFPVFLKSHF